MVLNLYIVQLSNGVTDNELALFKKRGPATVGPEQDTPHSELLS